MELKAGRVVMRVGPRWMYKMIPPGETVVVAADQDRVPANMVRVETRRPKWPTWVAFRKTLVVLPNAEPETIAWFRLFYGIAPS